MWPRQYYFGFSLFVVLLSNSQVLAWKPNGPSRHDVFSANEAFVLDVDPDKAVNTIYATGDRTRPLWSFSASLWLTKEMLSNDGSVVVVVNCRLVREEDIPKFGAVVFQNKDGIFREYSLVELCPNPRRTSDVGEGPGPVGDFWRTWYTDVTDDGERFVLKTTGTYSYEFQFSDGVMTRKWRNQSILYEWWFIAGIVAVGVGVVGFCILFVRSR